MTPCQLHAIDIGKRFGEFVALQNVSIAIEQGEFLTLLGPSGSGKTTLLMILAGFSTPSTGRLEEQGVDITRRPAEKRNFGMVFQGYALFPHMTVEANVDFPLRIRKRPGAERRRRVDEMLEVVGLTAHRHKKPGALSGGQQQRVAIARALVFEPDLLLLDEPLSALDKNLREQLQAELQRIHREIGTTFVFVTHDQGEALALASRIAIFHHGKLKQIGDPRAVYNRPDSRFVAEFLGKVNLFPLASVGRDGVLARGRFGEAWLKAMPAEGDDLRGPRVLAVRPEQMQLHTERSAANGHNLVGARVTETVYQGASTTLSLDAGHGTPPMTLTFPEGQRSAGLARGTDVWLSWSPDRGVLLPDRAR